MPKVSVIVPIYGVEKFLRECVDSILNQTLKDIEIILIDDGGKDNCLQIIDEYAQKDNRIIAIHKPNDGYGQTCNVGLEKATGEYVAIVEPDDYVALDMYETLYQKAIQYDLDLIKSDFYRFIGTLDNREYIYNALDIESKDYNKVINLQEYLDLLFDNPKKLYRILKNLRSWFEYLFSVTNLPSKNGKWYKVIYLLGLKFSFRNKEKEAKMKLLEESENK